MKKLYKQKIANCRDCPVSWWSYYGSYLFCRADKDFRDKTNDEANIFPLGTGNFPEWCPLPEESPNSDLET